jgi:hypothetical protein
MEEPDGAVHKPTIDYYRHPAGAILPLPVREKEVADRQREVYLQKKAEDKEAEQQEKQLIADDTEESAYDPDANPYDGIPYRNGKNGSYMKPSYNNASYQTLTFGLAVLPMPRRLPSLVQQKRKRAHSRCQLNQALTNNNKRLATRFRARSSAYLARLDVCSSLCSSTLIFASLISHTSFMAADDQAKAI